MFYVVFMWSTVYNLSYRVLRVLLHRIRLHADLLQVLLRRVPLLIAPSGLEWAQTTPSTASFTVEFRDLGQSRWRLPSGSCAGCLCHFCGLAVLYLTDAARPAFP